MRCELCRRDVDPPRTLCDTCAEAIRRLMRITAGPEDGPLRAKHKTADAAA
jgi:hypothetical protein